MGTTSRIENYKTLRDFMIAELIGNFSEEWGENFTLEDHSITGNILYLLIHSKSKDEKFISVVKCGKEGREFSYKYMDDSCQPYYYDCPERMLAKANNQSEGAQKWYALCRENKEIKASLKKIAQQFLDNPALSQKLSGTILELPLHKRKVEYQYMLNRQYFIATCQEDGRTYRWKTEYLPLKEWQELLKKALAA